jgi:hypothetical protein
LSSPAPAAPPARFPQWPHAITALGYVALTLLYLRPTWRFFLNRIPPSGGDPVFNLYVLKWGIHQIRLGLPDFWNAPFFFPAPATITYSDHLLGPAAVATVFTALFPNPLAAYNFLFFGSFVLTGWTACWVFRRYGLSWAAAFLGGATFAFSSFRWDQMSHLQMLLMHWIPLVLWSWDRLLAEASWKRAGLFLLFYALHVTGGSYLAFMIHVPMLALALAHLPRLRDGGRRRAWLRVVAPAAAAGALLFLAIYLPYVWSARDLGLERSDGEYRIYGASSISYGTPSASNFYTDEWFESWRRNENSLFAGLLPTALLLTGIVAGWRRRRQAPVRPLSRGRRAVLWALAALALAGWVSGDVWVWTERSPLAGVGLVGLGESYKAPAWLLAGGLLALVLRRRWGGNWPLRLADLDPWDRGLLFSGLVCALLTHPVVYTPLAEVVPGLSGMRVPARFYAFVSFSIAWFAGRALDAGLRRLSKAPRRWAAALVAAFLLAELWPKPLSGIRLSQERDFAPVYHWLAGRDDVRAVLELPIRDDATSVLYMYYGTRHWKPLVNGYSGYMPGDFVWLLENCCWPVPGGATLDRLRLWGVSHVLIHTGKLRQKRKKEAIADWEKEGEVRLVGVFGNDRVYEILPQREIPRRSESAPALTPRPHRR